MKSVILRRLYEANNEKVFWELLPVEVRNQRAVNDADAEVYASMNAEKLRAWDELLHSTTEACVHMADKAGIPVIAISQASIEWKASNGPLLLDQSFIKWFHRLESPHVACLSMREIFSKHDFVKLYADAAHLKPEGHLLMAKAIRDLLEQRKWLPSSHHASPAAE